jgi:hypothetical protein
MLAARFVAVPLCLPPMQSLVTGHAQNALLPRHPTMSTVCMYVAWRPLSPAYVRACVGTVRRGVCVAGGV